MFEVSDLGTFLVGTAVGASGQYMADRLTDQQRRLEENKDVNRNSNILRN
jgi:hypothetical protein